MSTCFSRNFPTVIETLLHQRRKKNPDKMPFLQETYILVGRYYGKESHWLPYLNCTTDMWSHGKKPGEELGGYCDNVAYWWWRLALPPRWYVMMVIKDHSWNIFLRRIHCVAKGLNMSQIWDEKKPKVTLSLLTPLKSCNRVL